MPYPGGYPWAAFHTFWNTAPAVSHQSGNPSRGNRSRIASQTGLARAAAIVRTRRAGQPL